MFWSRRHKQANQQKKKKGYRSAGRGNDDARLDLHLSEDDRLIGQMKAGSKKRAAISKKQVAKGSARKSQKTHGSGSRRKKSANQAPPRRSWLGSLFRFTVYWSVVAGIWAGICVACIVAYYAALLPNAESWEIPKRAPFIQILAADNTLIANRGKSTGAEVNIEDLPDYVPMSVVSIEDRRFYHHFGIDLIGLARAMITNLKAGRVVQGGSTLTQQLAKNLFLSSERTAGRKIQEAILALWLEQQYSKDEILQMYLNRVYFGSGNYGVEAASQKYFNKSATDINLREAALLAGLLKAPSRLAPDKNLDAALKRSNTVLAAMVSTGAVSQHQADNAQYTKHAKQGAIAGYAHYAADWVERELSQILKPSAIKQDLIVMTTIDPATQKKAEVVVKNTLDKYGKKRQVHEVALVSLDMSGGIRALIGGRNYKKSQFNRAIMAKRQPGSVFKPVVYLNAFKRGYFPESISEDKPLRIGKWKPENHCKCFAGAVSLRHAMAQSINTVAAKLAMDAGMKNIARTAKHLGVKSKLGTHPSLALGTSEVSLSEMTHAYLPFANGGFQAPQYIISQVKTKDGEVLYRRDLSALKEIIAPEHVAMMNSTLHSVILEGTGKKAKLGEWRIAGKTGTTQNYKDAWFIGYSSKFVTGVWLGNDDNKPMKKITGGSLPVEIWNKVMTTAHKGLTPEPLSGLHGAYNGSAMSYLNQPVNLMDAQNGYTEQPSRTIIMPPEANHEQQHQQQSQGILKWGQTLLRPQNSIGQ